VDADGGGLFACDGRVDEEKLRELLNVQVEQTNLDYKLRIDFSRGTKSRVEFVKDCAAMMTLPDGGYLVVGVDGQGVPQPGALSDSNRHGWPPSSTASSRRSPLAISPRRRSARSAGTFPTSSSRPLYSG